MGAIHMQMQKPEYTDTEGDIIEGEFEVVKEVGGLIVNSKRQESGAVQAQRAITDNRSNSDSQTVDGECSSSTPSA